MSETPLNQIVDTHYSGWLGILPDEIWSIIFKMVHQMNMKDIHNLLGADWKAVRNRLQDDTVMTVQGITFNRGIDKAYYHIKLHLECWRLTDESNQMSMEEGKPLLNTEHHSYNSNYANKSLLQKVTDEKSTVKYFKEQCKQNGLKGYSRKTRKGLIRMLMPL